MYPTSMAPSVYGTELPFRQSVAKIASERTAQVRTLLDFITFIVLLSRALEKVKRTMSMGPVLDH
jgi:hypothetical protein